MISKEEKIKEKREKLLEKQKELEKLKEAMKTNNKSVIEEYQKLKQENLRKQFNFS
ncbi:hypothetical protein ['Camptotheca acuminata' phytoplasma]|uniref:hypothetical protein n=1 Tax='Camptotheca acuminata' phytoplasma TaxID=3239192 RepID=UPI00351A8B68